MPLGYQLPGRHGKFNPGVGFRGLILTHWSILRVKKAAARVSHHHPVPGATTHGSPRSSPSNLYTCSWCHPWRDLWKTPTLPILSLQPGLAHKTKIITARGLRGRLFRLLNDASKDIFERTPMHSLGPIIPWIGCQSILHDLQLPNAWNYANGVHWPKGRASS